MKFALASALLVYLVTVKLAQFILSLFCICFFGIALVELVKGSKIPSWMRPKNAA